MAGRKKLDEDTKKQTRSFMLRPEACERLDALVKILGVPRGEIVERALKLLQDTTLGEGTTITPLEYSYKLKLDLIKKVLDE